MEKLLILEFRKEIYQMNLEYFVAPENKKVHACTHTHADSNILKADRNQLNKILMAIYFEDYTQNIK